MPPASTPSSYCDGGTKPSGDGSIRTGSAHRVAVGVEGQVRQIAGIDLTVDAQRDRHLLVAPLHHIERELDQLGA